MCRYTRRKPCNLQHRYPHRYGTRPRRSNDGRTTNENICARSRLPKRFTTATTALINKDELPLVLSVCRYKQRLPAPMSFLACVFCVHLSGAVVAKLLRGAKYDNLVLGATALPAPTHTQTNISKTAIDVKDAKTMRSVFCTPAVPTIEPRQPRSSRGSPWPRCGAGGVTSRKAFITSSPSIPKTNSFTV